MKTPERCQRRSDVFIANFEHVSHFFSASIASFEHVFVCCVGFIIRPTT